MVIMILLAFGAGVTIVVSRMINAKLAEYVGAHMSTLMNFVVGLIGAIVLAFILKAKTPETATFSIEQLPLYLGGVLGVAMVFIANVITKKIPAYHLTLLMFATQLFTGIILDYFVYDIFSAGKVVGGVFVVLGLIVSMKEDSIEIKE
jgi:transporter family-2 protein